MFVPVRDIDIFKAKLVNKFHNLIIYDKEKFITLEGIVNEYR